MNNRRAERRPTVSTKCNDYFELNCYGKTRSHHSFKLRHPLPSLRCSRPTHSTKPFVLLLYTEGLERLRRRQPLPRVNCFLHSFFIRIITQWNALPKEIQHVVHEQDFSTFRSKLRKYCKLL